MPPSKSLLPACKRCRAGKVRCDGATPRCSVCERTKSSCIFVDEADGQEFSRESIAQMENEEARLRSSRTRESSQALAPDEFVGEGSGSSFFETMLSSPQWRTMTGDLLHELRREQHDNYQPQQVQKASLLSAIEARFYIDTYLQGSHLHHPFCLHHELLAIHERLYSTSSEHAKASSQDYFRLYLLCAIAAISVQRRGMQTASPYSFFLAAQDYAQRIPVLGSIDAVQNLLLMARFGIYFHIGCSTWEIARLCMRQCIQLEYHLPPRCPIEPLKEQHQRRLFWECYILDRYASSTLGRPFAIADEDIEVGVPIPVSDEVILSQVKGAPLDSLLVTPGPPDNMTIFVWIVRLRQITSRIHAAFFAAADHSSESSMSKAGHVYAHLYSLLDELARWRQIGPVFAEAHSLYQRQEWYDFLLEKERLTLVRGAMNALTTKQNQLPPKTLTALCFEAATRVIQLYKQMYVSRTINCTRGYFQMLFTAGLSLMYCCSSSSDFSAAASPLLVVPNSVESTLQSCAEILQDLSKTLTDARQFSYAFEIVQRAFLTEYFGHRQSDSTRERREQDFQTSLDNDSGLAQETAFGHSFQAPHMSSAAASDGLIDDSWLTTDWSQLASKLMPDMEWDVNQYAVGDWMIPTDYEFDDFVNL